MIFHLTVERHRKPMGFRRRPSIAPGLWTANRLRVAARVRSAAKALCITFIQNPVCHRAGAPQHVISSRGAVVTEICSARGSLAAGV